MHDEEDEKIAMLASLENPALGDARRYRIGMRSGVVHVVGAVRLPGKRREGDREVVGLVPAPGGKAFEEVRFLAGDVEWVGRPDQAGLSPEHAAHVHAHLTSDLVDLVMGPGHEDAMRALRETARRCLRERPSWFSEAVDRHVGRMAAGASRPAGLDPAAMRSLLDDESDPHDVEAAAVLLLVDRCYEALESAYTAFDTQDSWMARALELLKAGVGTTPRDQPTERAA
jgi:hypothetical protein